MHAFTRTSIICTQVFTVCLLFVFINIVSYVELVILKVFCQQLDCVKSVLI